MDNQDNQSIGDGIEPGVHPVNDKDPDIKVAPVLSESQSVEIYINAIDELLNKLTTIYSDLLIIDEVIQEAINHDSIESLKVEFKDGKHYKSDYNEAYVKLKTLAQGPRMGASKEDRPDKSDSTLQRPDNANSGELIITKVIENKILNSGWVGSIITDDAYALLAASIVEITNSSVNSVQVRALLDNGSQYNFITTKCVKRLNSPLISISCCIKGIGNSIGRIKSPDKIKIFRIQIKRNLSSA